MSSQDGTNFKISKKKTISKNNLNRLDRLPQYPAAQAYTKLIENESLKQINHLFYDFSDRDNISLLVLTDNHWGSISSHFMPTICAQLVAKYTPGMYLIYNGDNRNNAINTDECASSSLDNAFSPVVELKLWYEVFQDEIIKKKTLCVNSGNHDNGKRTKVLGTDTLATFFAGTEYYKKYSRFATLLTIRLKANTKEGFKDVKVYVEHGNALSGGDGTKLDKGFQRAKDLGANVAIFGHVHQDMCADYRIEKLSEKETKSIQDDMSVIILPSTMDQEVYSLDARMETPPTDLKLIRLGTKENDYLLGSTQRERRSLNKTSIYCDCTTIPQKAWEFGVQEAKRLEKLYNKQTSETIQEIKQNASTIKELCKGE